MYDLKYDIYVFTRENTWWIAEIRVKASWEARDLFIAISMDTNIVTKIILANYIEAKIKLSRLKII